MSFPSMRTPILIIFALLSVSLPAQAIPRPATSGDAGDSGRLLRAATRQGPEAVRALLQGGADANARDGRKTPVLIGLCSLVSKKPQSARLLRSVQVLLDQGRADPNAYDGAYVGDSRSALHMAAASGNRTLVQMLLQHGANPHQPTRFGETPVYFAAEGGHLEIVYDLVRAGARIDLFTRHTHMNPLLAAAARGQWLMVRYLITLGADPRAKDIFGKSALELARENYYKTRSPGARKQLALTYLELDRASLARAARDRKIVLR